MTTRPTVLFDGTCGFCKRWVGRWRKQTGDRLEFVPFQSVERLDELAPELHEAELRRAVHLVEPDGRVTRGAHAVYRIRALGGIGSGLAWAYEHVPGVAPLAEVAYRAVAKHRGAAVALVRPLWGKGLAPSTFLLARWLLVRGLALVFAIAFLSFYVQADGLVGADGIVPLQAFLDAVAGELGTERFWRVPTVFWIDGSDRALHAVCLAGAGASVLLAAGVFPRLLLCVCWVLYVSLISVAAPWLNFQWDVLLVEAALLAIPLAPPGLWRPGLAAERPPTRVALWLVWWLVFRLMFGSGAVKLTSGDPLWADLTAMTLHYWTQPLPNPLAWTMHHLPEWFHRVEALAMFVVELGFPFLILLPRIPRTVACLGFTALMVGIGATGNYGFFNLLSIVLFVTLLDDAFLSRWLPRSVRARVDAAALPLRPPPATWRRGALGLAALVLIPLAGFVQWRRIDRAFAVPEPYATVERWLRPTHSVNAYGLFAVMTTTRYELVFEGSADGVTWQPYPYRWKPDDPAAPPCLAQPHMPRLDWQLWFAGLGLERHLWWIRPTMQRLLEGSPDVLELFASNPFPDTPPRFVRVVVWDYRFSSPEQREAEGVWWSRERLGVAVPPVSRR